MAVRPTTTLPVHRLDVETYNRMVASGALDDERVELLDGVLVDVSPASPAHTTVVTRLMRHFAAEPRWWTRVQCPLEIPPRAEPEPDLAVLAEEPPSDRHPRTALLVVEVAVSSYMIDRNVKGPQYAHAGIPVYWLINVPAGAIEVLTEPGPDGYARCETYNQGRCIPSPLDGVDDVDVSQLLAGVTD